MRPGSRSGALLDDSSHGNPRRLGALSEAAALISATHTASVTSASASISPSVPASTSGDHGGGEDEVMVYALDEADDEDLRPEDHFDDDEDGESNNDNGNEEDDDNHDNHDDDDDDESLCYGGHHHCPIHHSPHHPLALQPTYYEGLDGYLSDDLDMSDDAGAPLVDYLVANLLANEMDMDGPADSDSDLDFSSAEDGGSNPEPAFLDEAMIAHSQSSAQMAAAFMSMLPHGPVPPPVPNPPALPPLIDPLGSEIGGQPTNTWFEPIHPAPFLNPSHANTIGPSNYGLTEFLHHWARQSRILQGLARGRCPWPARVNSLESEELTRIRYADLEGDHCDFQGVDWEDIGVTRESARERRLLTYSNYVNVPESDKWTPDLPDVDLPRRDSFFRFRSMDFRRNIHLSHFQLRNVLASTSRSRVFYPGVGAVHQYNPMSGNGRAIMKINDAPISQISALAADHDVLVAGGFGGEYTLRHLNSGEPESRACHEGVITNNISGITNHVKVHQARTSSAPLAAFASNDHVFRVLDMTTESWLSAEKFDFALNCTAVSPDRRLRVMVGDSLDVLITAAESRLSGDRPEILHKLPGHRDYGFACDWADDGWTIATAFQDKSVKIWDARRFTDSSGNEASVCTIRSEMAGVRSLRFSPIGSGKRVLVAAEEADFVNIIDAQTFRSKQTVDVFGELGGISFTNGGQDLMVLCCDRTRGGILQLERCNAGEEGVMWSSDEEQFGHGGHQRRSGTTYDWPRSMFTEERRVRGNASRRRRRVAAQVDLEPF